MLTSGAQSAHAIAQQLLFYAYRSEEQKEFKAAFSYYAWAERFDRHQPWSLLHRLWKCLPSHPGLFVPTLNECMEVFYTSWVLQLYALMHAYAWIRYFLIVFVYVIFAGIGFRYLPQAIHPLVDRLPEDTPAPLKTLLPLCLVFSFISFGVLPFLWLIAFITWRFADNGEKILFAFAILFMACAPFDARVRDMFRQALMPQGSLALYIRSSEEGYSSELHRRALEKIVLDRTDVLAYMSASLCAMKNGDTAGASLNAKNALSLRPDDPAILLLAGNASYLAGDYKTAANYYQRILSKYPGRMNARFNLAQCYARKSDTTVDLDFVKTLSVSDQNAVNNFINANTMYFGENAPALRQIISLSHPPSYFWKNLFPFYSGSWTTTAYLWGDSFMGLSPKTSLAVVIILVLLFIAWNIFIAVRKQGGAEDVTCRICKRAICTRCKKGELCVSCYRATKFIRNVKMLATLQTSIIQKRQSYHTIAEYLLDIVLPGSGMLFSKKHSPVLVMVTITATCLVYASYFFLTSVHLGYPLWVIYDNIEAIPRFFMLYNAIFVVRALIAFLKKKEAVII